MELDEFRTTLINAVRERVENWHDEVEMEAAFVYEAASRLESAEEFQDFIPCAFSGTGTRNRKLKVSGYEIDEADASIRLLISEYDGTISPDTLTLSRAEIIFGHLRSYVEEAVAGRWDNSTADEKDEASGLAETILTRQGSISRYRFYLVSDSLLSERVREIAETEINGIPVEYHIWDISRFFKVSKSLLGAEAVDIDFTQFYPGGIPCLKGSHSDDLDGYLCVIPGNVLAGIYDKYGSRLLEGNVRSFLSARGEINRDIQRTIKDRPEKFFFFNNGISATASAANVIETSEGLRLCNATYLQIVNGGQTTASLLLAKSKGQADLNNVHVQMKLTVVRSGESEVLDEMIMSIAKFSNRQNKVSEADFFANDPFHRKMETRSRRIAAPATGGAQYQSYWFYERARGQYVNETSKMTRAETDKFIREHPKNQVVTKTDLARYENTWLMLPHIVSTGAQKNFKRFAENVKAGRESGQQDLFDSDTYFREAIARAITFRATERLVTSASWYERGYRANIVTYAIAKLADMLLREAPGRMVSLENIWKNQEISPEMRLQLDLVARAVAEIITSPPLANMNVTEWCKKEACWTQVLNHPISLTKAFLGELLSREQARETHEIRAADAALSAVMTVISLKGPYWMTLEKWGKQNNLLYGKELDLVKSASNRMPTWIPTDKQAKYLLDIRDRLMVAGFV